jgi:hypothetical protein
MDTIFFVMRFLMYMFIASPVCLLLHELGHASMILLLTEQKVTFQFGEQGVKREFENGRLKIILNVELSALFFCRYLLEDKSKLSRYQDFWISIGGPLSSLLFTFISGILWLTSNGSDPWTGLALINFISLLNTSLPRHYPKWQGVQGGLPSDGLQLMQLLRK